MNEIRQYSPEYGIIGLHGIWTGPMGGSRENLFPIGNLLRTIIIFEVLSFRKVSRVAAVADTI